MSLTDAFYDSEKSKYFLNYDSILSKNLHKMLNIEYFLAFIAALNLAISLWIYNTTSFDGIGISPGNVQVYLSLWKSGINTSYILVWGQIVLGIIVIIFRKQFQELTKIPKTIQLDQENSEANKNLANHDNIYKSEDNVIGTALRDLRLYYIIIFVGIGTLIGYLNYFPRGTDLFPSIIQVSIDLWVIESPAEYTSFFWINTIWGVILVMIFFFLMMFSFRQIKDMRHVIRKQKKLQLHQDNVEENQSNSTQVKDSWKPALTKPWEKMNISERKEYQMRIIQLEKERARLKQQERFQQLVNEERERRRVGDDFFEKKQKEKKQEVQLLKKQQKMKDTKQETKFDFR